MILILSRIYFSFFLFVFRCFQRLFTASGKYKKRPSLTPFQPFKSIFFILFTNPLPPKRSANVEENFIDAKQYVEISCLHQLRCWNTSRIICTAFRKPSCCLYNKVKRQVLTWFIEHIDAEAPFLPTLFLKTSSGSLQQFSKRCLLAVYCSIPALTVLFIRKSILKRSRSSILKAIVVS